MAKSKRRRKIVVFSLIGLVLAGLGALAIFRKREVVITVQTEKVIRTNLTEIVPANGKIQPVVQVKISPEVSGEITALPFKEGQAVAKGDLIVKIKPDFYQAARNQAEAGYKASLAGKSTAEANFRKAEAEFRRNEDLLKSHLVSDSAFDEVKAAFEVAEAQMTNSEHQCEVACASLASADDSLSKTTIVSPLTGTVSKLDSEVGERVVGTATMAGTEIMTIADLTEMEARVDVGEMDVVLIAPGQNVRLEVDAFRDRKFSGTVTEIANSSKTTVATGNQEGTKFEVKIRIKEKEAFRPGMSVTAEIETRSRTNVLVVPFASVTTRLPKDKDKDKDKDKKSPAKPAPNKPDTNVAPTQVASADPPVNSPGTATNSLGTTNSAGNGTNQAKAKPREAGKPVEVVFVMDGDRAKMVPVKTGISDDTHWEITEGLKEGQEVISGGFRAISRDLEDGKKIRKGPALSETEKEKENK